MKKILKKSLACMLAAILCLTACVGAMASVSAEDAITYTIADVAINQGESGTIDVTVGNFADVAGLIAEITLPDAVVSIDGVKLNGTAALVKMTDDEPGHYVLNGKTIKFVGLFNSLDEFNLGNVDALTINIAVTVADEASETTFAAPVFQAGTELEQILAVNGTVGKLTVKAVCKHEDVTTVKENEVPATCYAEGSYDEVVKCSCGYVVSSTPKTIEKIAHTPAEAVVENNVDATCYAEGSYDSVVYCSVEACKAEISRTPVTVEKTEHTPAEAVVENNVDATCYAEGSYDSVVYCSVEACKHEISRTPVTVEKIAHTPAEAVEENRVEAQPGVAGSYDMVVYCSVAECKAELSRTPNEIPALPVEPQGPAVDNTLVFAAKPSVVYGTASIEMAFRVANTVLAKYDDVKIVIIPQKYDTTTLNLVENPAEIVVNKEDLVKAGSTRMQYYFKDLMLYELGLDVNYLLRGYDAEGNLVAISETFTTSVADYLKTNILASNDSNYKTMATDTLIVCDTVMKNVAVNYPNSDLANATSVIDGFDISAASQTVGAYNTIDDFNSYNAEYTQASSATHQIRSSVQVEKVAFINFRIADSKKALDLNKLVVKVSYTSKDSAGEHPYSKEFTGSDFTYAGKYINLKFDQVGIHDSNKDILFEVTYDGVPMCDWTYSVETYLGANQEASNGTMIVALLKLGQSFRTYQGL